MTALALTLAIFAGTWLVGLAALVLARAETADARVVLTSPLVGSALYVLVLFVFSHAGIAIGDCAVPTAGILLGGSTALLVWRRPALPSAVPPVIAISVGGALLAGWPMLGFGFEWLANANDDMAVYVLSAERFLTHGLHDPFDAIGLARGRNYPTVLQTHHEAGVRPGGDLGLAGVASVTGRSPSEVYMPLILALHLAAACGVAALALQAARRGWAAAAAAAFFVVSPLATYGALQQLLAQVFGLGLAAALCALLMRVELHRDRGVGLGDVVPIGLLVAALILVYVELTPTIALAYLLYVGVLAIRRDLQLRPCLRLWVTTVLITVVTLNTYLIGELHVLSFQAGHGGNPTGDPPIFGFTLVPSALPGIVGLQTLPPAPTDAWLDWSIAVAAIVLAGLIVMASVTAARGVAASVVLVAYMVVAFVLAASGADFGLFKLYMFIQPFLAAAAAVWLTQLRRPWILALATIPLALVIASQLSTQRVYVDRSRDPIDLRHASSDELLPAFRRFVADSRTPVVAAIEHPTLAKLGATSVKDRPVHFVSNDFFSPLADSFLPFSSDDHKKRVELYERLQGWRPQQFDLRKRLTEDERPGSRTNAFLDNRHASSVLSDGRCTVVLPTGSQLVLNRRIYPEESPDLVALSCEESRDTLVFTQSALGKGFYSFDLRHVSLFQLESDHFYPGKTFAGLGRYVLFRVLQPSAQVRLAIDVTKTLRQDGSNRLPRAAAVGSRREAFPLIGRGSGRVFSPPLRPQMIGGQPYLLLDMGEDGRLLPSQRSGLAGIYGRSIALDPRFLTSFARDISLVSEAEYRRLQPPAVIRRFPADLDNPDLEYSGIYEDGWVAERSYFMLPAGPARDLVLRADVRRIPTQRLQVLVDGRLVLSQQRPAGRIDLRAPILASHSRRRVELRWASAPPLSKADPRPASARLTFVGLAPRASR